jgi:adenine-specific DNA-methyltransferase
MEKIIPQTKDITIQNIEQIAKLFPQVITEIQDVNGNTVKSVNFELLKQYLSQELLEVTSERYRLDWPGKRASILKANTPITSTLKPDRESSVNFDTTENVYIEGDNFEVLKILQESYLGKIKMIYIDPPYNTGNDFVYKDDFKVSKDDYEEELGAEDEEGGKLFKNTDTNGRFHSDWLSMMYERLLVARDLLNEDGVIFISIDDNEVHNLRKIADEVFGEENFVSQIVWKSKYGAGAKTNGFIDVHEYILCFSKKSILSLDSPINEESKKGYNKKDEKFIKRGGYFTQPLMTTSMDDRPNLQYSINYNGVEIKPRKQWVWSKERLEAAISNNSVVFSEKSDGSYSVRAKQYLKDEKGIERKGKPLSVQIGPYTQEGTSDIKNLFDKNIFGFTKPVNLLKYLFSFSINGEDVNEGIYLDFFSGSASSAQATMQLNTEDGGNRKFIMVQLQEETDEASEACKAGYKTIPEIGKERIRRAGLKILEENTEKLIERETPLDIGFRVYKTAESILKNVAKHPNAITQTGLFDIQDNIKENATDEDILTAVILDFGEKLDNPIEIKTIAGATVFLVDTDALVACFSKNIDMQVVEEIAKMKPLRAVFRDACFKDDKDLINTVESRFKQLAPNTKVHVI